MKTIPLILSIFLSFCLSANGQTVQITDQDGVAVPSVQVFAIQREPVLFLLANGNGVLPVDKLVDGEPLVLRCIGYDTDTVIFRKTLTSVKIESAKYDLGEVLITAQYQPVALEKSVLAARTIGAPEIKQRAAVNMRDLLEKELNFRVSEDNILGSGMSMQGLGGQNVKIMIDGVPVIGRLDGNIDISQINLNNIKRVEIIEGPLAVNYGSNALAGTINLITKAPKTNEATAGAEFFTESAGYFNTSAHASLGFKNQSLSISGGRNYFDGWNPGDSEFYHQRTNVADTTRAQQWNPKDQLFADAKYRYIFKKGYAEIAGSWFDEEIINRGNPRGAYQESAIDDTYKTLRYGASAKLQFQISDNWSSHHLLAYNLYRRNKSTYITDLTGVESTLSTNNALQDTSVFSNVLARGSFIGKLNETINLQLGYEIEIETAEGKRVHDNTGQIDNYALFATSEWRPFEKLTVKPGLRWAYNSRYNAPLIPSLNVLYQLPRSIQARLSYAQGFRSPGLKELAFYFVDVNHNIQGNSDLDAERSNNFSASLTAKENQERKIGWNISGFYNQVYNLITLAQQTTTLYSYVNIGEQQTFGGRVRFDTQLRDLSLALGATYTGVSSNIDETDNQTGFLFTPEAMLRAGYAFAKSGIIANLIYKFNGRRNFFSATEDGRVTEEFIEAYQNLDFNLSRSFLDEMLNVQIGARNIFNVQNITATANGGVHSSGSSISIGTGRTYFLQLSLNLSKPKK